MMTLELSFLFMKFHFVSLMLIWSILGTRTHTSSHKLVKLLMHSSSPMLIFECIIDCLWFNLGDKSCMIAEVCHTPSCRNTFVDLPHDVFNREIPGDLPLFWKITLQQIFNRLFRRIYWLIFCTVFQILQEDILFIFFCTELCLALLIIVSFIKNNMLRFFYSHMW